jgi:ABC-type transport system involved in multi-copper enzyme maturation permease subunit
MKLLKLELYKIFSQKMIYITFLILILLSSMYILNFEKTDEQTKQFYKEREGTLTSEKILEAEASNDQLMAKAEERIEEMKANGTEGAFLSDNEEVQSGIYEDIAFSQRIQAAINLRLQDLESSTKYNAALEKQMLKNVDLSYYSFYKGPAEIIDYTGTFAFVVTGAMLLIGLSSTYTREYSSGVDNYILSSKKGRTVLTWSKLGAALIYTLIVVAAWEAVNVISKLYLLGNFGWESPLQFVFRYFASPYGLNMLDFHLIQLGIHLAAAFGFAVLILFISSISRNSLLSFFISGAIFSLPFMLVEMVPLKPWLFNLVHFSYLYIMRVDFLFNSFKTINIIGNPVLYPVAAVLWMVVLSVALAAGTFKVLKNKEISM